MSLEVTYNEVPNGHKSGHGVSLCVDQSGANEVNFVSYGGDAVIHVWSLAADTLQPEIERSYDGKKESNMVPGPLAWTGDHVYVVDNKKSKDPSAENTIWRFDLESLSAPRRQDERYPSNVTAISTSEDGNYLLCASKELLRNFHLSIAGRSFDSENFASEMVRAVAFDPLSQIYAVLTNLGSVKFYNVQKISGVTESGCTQILSVPAFSDSEKLKTSMCFSRESDQLYVPSKGRIVIFRRDGTSDWEEATFLPYSGDEEICLCALSKGGRFLATSTASNKIVVWDVEASHPRITSLFAYKSGKAAISSIIWNPADEEEESLIIGDVEGKINVVSTFLGVVEGVTSNPTTATSDFFDMEAEEDSTMFDDLPVKMKNKITPLEDDEDTGFSIGAIKSAYSQAEELGPTSFAPTTTVVEYEPPVVPSCFSSGASPEAVEEILETKEHGSIIAFDDSDLSQLEIRFHDTAIHHPIVISNENPRYVLGDITPQAIVLASVRDGSTPSELYVHHIKSIDVDNNKAKWSVQLSGKESIQLVTVGRRFVVVYTTSGFIRVFSLAGTQRAVFSHPSPVLTMCATKNLLTVISINGGAFFVKKSRKPNFNITASVYTVDLDAITEPVLSSNISVPVTPGSELVWAHYGASGALCTMDSECCVRMLSASGMWVPILMARDELLSSDSDYLWPVAVTTEKILYFLCTDNLTYPDVARKDIRTASFQLPVLAKGTQTSEAEGSLMVRNLMLGLSGSFEDTSMRKMLASDVRKLFLYTLANGFENRAAELAWLVSTEKELRNMCQLITNNREKLGLREQFCDKISEIGREALNKREGLQYQQPTTSKNSRLSVVEPKPVKNDDIAPFRPKIRSINALSRPSKRTLEEFESQNDISMTSDAPATPSMTASTATPMSSGNPFASRGSARPTLDDSMDSIFDVLSAPSSAKRVRRDEKPEKSTSQRQSRLSFTPAANKTDENAFPKMNRWVADHAEELQTEYDSCEEADGKSFEAFALAKYRAAKKMAKAQEA
ncbi:hypothetical protein L596_027993 [Steinernema carpocapsae]|uniref:WDHD1/CFT4 second beta-propeller domain-containing protein n=1 Tax=Steinernema carpocapsae TaxID=34508 RepID=A0A4V5ZXR9_STECR|nr:hypothetical protein L596_027993 [Steinernema carpocapsae]